MSDHPTTRQFLCEHCQTTIQIPYDLPPTVAPCPHCGEATKSPPLDAPPPVDPTPVTDSGSKGEERGEGSGKSSAALLTWVMAAVILLGLIAGGIYLLGEMEGADGPSPKQAGARSEPNPDLVFDGVGVAGLDVLRAFFSASTAEEKAKYVIGGEKLVPALRDYYRDDESGRKENESLRPEQFIELSLDKSDTDRGIYLLDYYLPRQLKFSDFFTPVTKFEVQLGVEEPDPFTRARTFSDLYEMEASRARVFFKRSDDKLLFDWETYVQTKDRQLREFTRSPLPGVSRVFRVQTMEDGSTIFSGDPDHRFYRFEDAAHSREDYVVIAVVKDSTVGRILESLAWTDIAGRVPTERGATVELKWSDEPTSTLGVTKVICWEFLGVGGDPSNLNADR